MFRIAICDDEPVFSAQIDAIIGHWPARPAGLRTELFSDGDSLIRAHEEMPFDIILLDVLMPLLNGIETAAEIRSKDKNVKIVLNSRWTHTQSRQATTCSSPWILPDSWNA